MGEEQRTTLDSANFIWNVADAALREFMQGDNSSANKQYKFDQTVDNLLLEFVNTKLELYKKLTDARINPMFKSKWFEGYQSAAG